MKLRLDLDQFWKDDALADQENCFSASVPQVALGIRMSNACVWTELGEEGHPWDPIDPVRQAELNRRYNDKAEKIVGRRLLQEHFDTVQFPYVKRISSASSSTCAMCWTRKPASGPRKRASTVFLLQTITVACCIRT